MKEKTDFEQIYRHPKFIEMTGRRRRISYSASLFILLAFALYMGAMSFAPGFLGASWNGDSAITYGFIFTLLTIAASVLVSGYYTWWANKHFDELKNELLKDLGNDR